MLPIKDGDFMPRHVVRPGDTIKAIIKKYNVTFQNLALANSHLENLERINPGDVIHIPDNSDGAFSIIETKTLKPQLLTMIGFSTRQIQEHYKLYQDYISKLNEVRSQLCSINPDNPNSNFSNFNTLKSAETRLASNYKLHELFFENLGGKNGNPSGSLLEVIVRDFGSYDLWLKDFISTGLSSNGWAFLGYDYDDFHLHNYLQDANNTLPLRFEPLLALDINEHAYFLDYGTNRKSYIDAFFRNVDWQTVASRFANIKLFKV